MRPWYAINARQLLESRQRGRQPAGPVSVVLTGQYHAAPTLIVRDDMPLDRLDWRMLVNLQVWLWAAPTVPLDRVLRTARAIAAIRPAELILRFQASEDIHDVEVGSGVHVPAVLDLDGLHSFTWSPINLSCTAVGAQLRRALLTILPQGSVL